jgi:hypothetical protein
MGNNARVFMLFGSQLGLFQCIQKAQQNVTAVRVDKLRVSSCLPSRTLGGALTLRLNSIH